MIFTALNVASNNKLCTRILGNLLALVLGGLLSGCATPPAETTNAISRDLLGDCQTRFIRGVFGDGANANTGYQYNAHMRRAFAIGFIPAAMGGQQVCSHSWGGWAATTEQQVDALAVSSCNRQIPGGTGCVLYARGNDVVYDRPSHLKLIIEVEQQQRLQAAQRAEEQQRLRQLEQQRAAETKRLQEEQAAKELARAEADKAAQAVAEKNALDSVRKTCTDLGFKTATEGFGKCVLQLLERDRQRPPDAATTQRPTREGETVNRGDGTPDDVKCREFGYPLGSTAYADCRLKLDSMRRLAEERGREFERQQREYEAKVAEHERQRKIAASMALMQCGLNMVAGNSCSGARVGPAPVPPVPPGPFNQTLVLPGGRTVYCTTVGTITNCR